MRAFFQPQKLYTASFTVEAALVLAVVFMTYAGLIRHAYTLHDIVTGKMILTEILEEARYCWDENTAADQFEQKGIQLGNPRLWLGEYRIHITERGTGMSGTAEAGEWKVQIDVKKARPSAFLREVASVEEMVGRNVDDGSEVQAGDEPELYDFASDDGTS